ncbi:hypothetical protein ONZ45_g2714 [Pleurotus djamor]|nr:hypothetical protein ONZ45_g2714 [Pleurotus djamor]
MLSARITSVVSFVCLATLVAAKVVTVQVGANRTNDATQVFTPQVVEANAGDTVRFNFTNGNHSVTQSSFEFPCRPIHEQDPTINGFNSDFRPTNNGTAITTLDVQIQNDAPIYFYDANTCGDGGVGSINLNETSGKTLTGFEQNAQRFNGTPVSTSSSSSASHRATGTPSTSATSAETTSNSGDALKLRYPVVAAALLFIPLFL